MDRHMAAALDRWLTTDPRESWPDEDEEVDYGCEFCGSLDECRCEEQYEEACREMEREPLWDTREEERGEK